MLYLPDTGTLRLLSFAPNGLLAGLPFLAVPLIVLLCRKMASAEE